MNNDEAFINSEEAFRHVMNKAAKALCIEPYQVTRDQFLAFGEGICSRRAVQQMGGFTYLKDQFFPYPVSPFVTEEAQQLKGDALADYIAEIIKKVAKEKDIPISTLTWNEFRRWIRWGYGNNAVGIAGNLITKAGGYNRIRDGNHVIEPTKEIVDRTRLMRHAAMNRKLGEAAAEKQYIFNRLDEWAKQFSGAINFHIPKVHYKAPAEETYHVVISDDHFGSDIKVAHTGILPYGTVEEARRLASVARQLIQRVKDKRKSDLIIWMLGDIIENRLHTPKDGEIISRQIMRAMKLLTQFIRVLAPYFRHITVVGQTGNHDRLVNVDPKRAIVDKSDSAATIIYYAVMNACDNLGNISWEVPETPYSIKKVYDFRFLGTHGDTFFAVRNTSKTIPIGDLVNAANNYNAALDTEDRINAFIFGHHHSYSHTAPSDDFIFNSPLTPPNAFGQVVGASPKSQCGQMMFVSVPDNPVYYSALLRVGKKDDKDASLDELIKPFVGNGFDR